MKDLLIIACGAGIQDGVNPCILMACAVFINQALWLKKMTFRSGWLLIVFAIVYALGLFAFNFEYVQLLVLQKNFIFVARVLYFILSVWAFVSGIVFLKDWFLIRRGSPVQEKTAEKIKIPVVLGLILCLSTMALGTVLSALATLWPVNKYILVLGNAIIIKGQWQTVWPILLGYVVTSMWLLWAVWAFLNIKNVRPSLLKIVCAAVFFAASSCMIFMFK